MGSGGTLGATARHRAVTNSGVIAPGSATPGFSGSPMGAFTINGNYTGVDCTMAINTVLGGDGSPSDKLVISGAGTTATGDTTVHVTNAGGPGAETPSTAFRWWSAVWRGHDLLLGRSPFPLANSGRGPSTMICSEAASGASTE